MQARLLIQLEQLEEEAKAVYDSIMKSTDGFQYADPQKIEQVKTQKHDVKSPLVLRTSCRRRARMRLRILEFMARKSSPT